MMRYVLILAYDGTDYGGWQIQKNKITVQEKLEDALKSVFGERVCVTGSGRTDAGVHAAAQVCHFDVQTGIPAEKIADALNMRLPQDISVLKSYAASGNFDANRSAKRKTYCYRMYLSPRRNPLKDRFSVWVKGGADVTKMREAAALFEGRHDFKAYCKSGSKVKTTEREIYSVKVVSHSNGFGTDVEIRVCGNGFLYNMVRTVAGTLLYFSQGVLSLDSIKKSLYDGDRDFVGKTMPARGLMLESVEYDD